MVGNTTDIKVDLWYVLKGQNRALRRLTSEVNAIRHDANLDQIIKGLDRMYAVLEKLEKQGLGGTSGEEQGHA